MRENVSTRLDSELYKRMRIEAIEQGLTFNTMMEMSMELYLEFLDLKKGIKNHSEEEYIAAFKKLISKGL